MSAFKLIVNLRGNKSLLLDKVIYTEHELSKKLKDRLISEYTPKWTKNSPQKVNIKEKKKDKEKSKIKEKLGWDNF